VELILLGAGASYGAEPAQELKPPLGKDLYPALAEKFSSWQNLPEDAREVFHETGDFEQGMGYLDNTLDRKIMSRLMRDMARYFLSMSVTHNNSYLKLAKAMVRRPLRYIAATMNYDMLLEGSCYVNGAGYNTRRPGEDLKSPTILKLHGSCAWLPNKLHEMDNLVFNPDENTYIDGPLRPNSPSFIHSLYDKADSENDETIGPCMAIYAKGKRVANCPTPIRHIQEDYSRACIEASKIFIVGARISDDDHIWGPVERAACPVFFINPDTKDRDKFREWSAGRSGKSFTRLAGFEQFANEI
jgi:hypothetical protein